MKQMIMCAQTIILFLAFFPGGIFGQKDVEKAWSSIVPLVTSRGDVEAKLGQSITSDKSHPFQTYHSDFGRITVVFANGTEQIPGSSCKIKAGKVVSTFISPRALKLTDLKINLNSYIKNDTYSPRELSYFSESEQILIATSIVKNEVGNTVEMVIAIENKPNFKKYLPQCFPEPG